MKPEERADKSLQLQLMSRAAFHASCDDEIAWCNHLVQIARVCIAALKEVQGT